MKDMIFVCNLCGGNPCRFFAPDCSENAKIKIEPLCLLGNDKAEWLEVKQ